MNRFFVTIGHSSENIPEKFLYRINPKANLAEIAEPSLREIFTFPNTPQVFFGIHQCIINVNRQKNNIDPKTKETYPKKRGLFPIQDFHKEPIFLDGKELTAEEKQELIEKHYNPFFAKIDTLTASGNFDFFVDAHLMNNGVSNYKTKSLNERPDICIGTLGCPEGEVCKNREGTTLSKSTSISLKELFRWKGYSCNLNRPFAGGYIMTRYLGKFPCFQLEINKRLLMNADDGEVIPEKAIALKKHLTEILTEFAKIMRPGH